VTTSYSENTNTTASGGQPKKDSKGHLVWNPSVGHYYEPAAKERESYGGIVGALQDVQVAAGRITKAYPHNFAGIIAAIQDITAGANLPPVHPGPDPGGGQLDEDDNWIEIIKPNEGELWFDTRQGRLFVYVNDHWTQTNGADGLAVITEDASPPTLEPVPAPGQFYFDKQSGGLLIHDGQYIDVDGNIYPEKGPNTSPLWRLINEDVAAALQTTGTLPLTIIAPRISEYVTPRPESLLPDIDLALFHTQKDYNEWLFAALAAVDAELGDLAPVIISVDRPDEPKPGQLWYDSATLDMSVWYVDEDGDGQWVPTSTPYTYDEDLAEIAADLAEETRLREVAVANIYNAIDTIDISGSFTVKNLQAALNNLDTKVNRLEPQDLSSYATGTDLASAKTTLNQRIDAIAIPDIAPYVKQTDLDQELENLEAMIGGKASVTALNQVQQSIPDVTAFITQADVNASISNITTEYLPRTGGTLTGSFTLNKLDSSLPGIDFSTSPANSKTAFKFQAVAPTQNNFSTFGSTNKFWEQAWNFSAEEDFCWIYSDTNKVFSITKDGPACSQLYIGDFSENNTNGRVIHNKIDVKERLNSYQTAFENIRQGVSSATDFDTLKANILSALANV
jgi:hypothetical protein